LPGAPLTDPGGRYSRTGLFKLTRCVSPAGRFASFDPSFLRHLVACACFVSLFVPSPASGLAPCRWLLWTNPTPGVSGSAACRCASLPAWPSQLVRQELSGPPQFRVSPSTRATLLDPGRWSTTSPLAVAFLLGSVKQTTSPPAACTFEAELLKPDATPACGSRFSLSTLLDGRSTRSNATFAGLCPSTKQPSVLGGWLNLSIQFFRSKPRQLGHQAWGSFTPSYTRLLWAHPLSAVISL
jgi:hypothetical protein